ncbi:MAG: hypothetical protein AMJ88_13350 [Anaerolineae bacterium SM23_ 63]|nr:MAG: hypothetical protein AMJ88_13350 [Anaerolineae bacterium SM23_ 63]
MTKKLLFVAAVLFTTSAGCSTPVTPTDPTPANTIEPTTAPVEMQHLATPTITSSYNETGEFSIYLVKQEISSGLILETDLDQLELEEVPILSIADITTYTWETHEMELTPSAYWRMAQLQASISLGVGLPFVICVGSERVYGGAFWTSYSSAIFGGIVIDVYPAEKYRPIRIQLGYPSAEWFTAEDLRSDPRIFQSLDEAGKLR